MKNLNFLHINNFLLRGTLVLSALILAAVLPQQVFAQVNVPPVGGDSEVHITAFVSGCGDGTLQTNLAEQCEGTDLNSQSCITLGFDSGILSCRPTCVFDTSSCENAASNPLSTSRRRSNTFNSLSSSSSPSPEVPNTSLSFSGVTEPGSQVFIYADGSFVTDTYANIDGTFFTIAEDSLVGLQDFTFYSIAEDGSVVGTENFSFNIQEYMTTKISNIQLLGSQEELPSEIADTSSDAGESQKDLREKRKYFEQGDPKEALCNFLELKGTSKRLSIDFFRFYAYSPLTSLFGNIDFFENFSFSFRKSVVHTVENNKLDYVYRELSLPFYGWSYTAKDCLSEEKRFGLIGSNES